MNLEVDISKNLNELHLFRVNEYIIITIIQFVQFIKLINPIQLSEIVFLKILDSEQKIPTFLNHSNTI